MYLMRLEEERSICLRRLVLTSNSSKAAAPASSSTTSTTSVVLINKPRDLARAGDAEARSLSEGLREDTVSPTPVGAALWVCPRVGPAVLMEEDGGCTMKPDAAEHRHAANTTEADVRGLRFAIISRRVSLALYEYTSSPAGPVYWSRQVGVLEMERRCARQLVPGRAASTDGFWFLSGSRTYLAPRICFFPEAPLLHSAAPSHSPQETDSR